jgi:DNA-binding ferritin-like protein
LAIFSKKEGVALSEIASHVRLQNHIKKLGAKFEQVEYFIKNIADSKDPQKLFDTANQIAQLSTSIPLDKMIDYIKRQQKEIQRINEEIENARTILEQKNVDIQTIDEFKKSEEELQKYNLPFESTPQLVSVLQTINQLGYDPQKIVKELGRIKSLRQIERRLKDNCKVLESRTNRYQEIIHLCEQLISLGIGFAELSAFHAGGF